MKKIYSIKERIIYPIIIMVLGVLQLILLINHIDNNIIVLIACACITVVVTLLTKLFYIPYHIVFNNNRVQVYDIPLLATNKFFKKKRSLILWNSEIDIDEIKGVELVRLTKEEKLNFIGYNHFSDKYIKVSLKNSNSVKYIYVSVYSKSQIDKIIKMLTNK